MKYVIKYRLVILFVLLGLTGLIGAQITNLTSDAGISALLPQNDPDYLYWQETEEIFGASEQVVIGITAKDTIYKVEHLQLVHELTTFLEELDDVEEDDVVSLSNVDDMIGLEDELLVEPLIETDIIDEFDTEALAALRQRVRTNPLFAGKLVNTDERSTVVIAGVIGEITDDEHRVAVLKAQVTAKIDKLRAKYPEAEILLSGMPIMNALITEYMQRDISRLFPLAMLVVLLLLFFLLRSLLGMLAPILVTLFSIVWTFGFKGALGSPLTLVETIIPVMLIAIGCADGVHILSEFQEFRKKGYQNKDAVLETMRLLTVPVIMTSVTTAIGFSSLVTSPGMSIRNMGLFLGFGVMVAMVFSLLFIPALISYSRPQKGDSANLSVSAEYDPASHSTFHRFMEGIGAQVLKYRILFALASVLILGISVYGALHLNVEASEFKYLKLSNPLRIDTDKIGERLGGVVSLDIVLEGHEMDSMKDPAILQAMRDLQEFSEQQEQISYTLSLADYVKRINYVLHSSDPEYDRIPYDIETVEFEDFETVDGQEVLVTKTEDVRGTEQVAQFLLLYDMGGGDDLDDVVDSAYQIARVIARLNDPSTRRLTELMTVIRPYVEQRFADLDVTVRFSNYYSYLPVSNLIIKSQIYSLGTVFVAIIFLLTVLFRSLVAGLITSLPVFIAVLFNFAVMWLFRIELNIGTSIVAAVGMGIGIDYAIHYYSRFRLLFKETQDYSASLVQAVAETSRAILFNAFAVGMGFMVLIFSEYYAVANIGWITALSMLTTALSSLLALPAMLALFKPKIATVKRRKATELSTKVMMEY